MRLVAGEEYLEMVDVAGFLGVSRGTIYKMRMKGAPENGFANIPSIKWGKRLLFKKHDIKKWFDERGKHVNNEA